MEIVVMLLTVAVCLLAVIAFVAVMLLMNLHLVLRAIAHLNLHLLAWKDKFDTIFVDEDAFYGDDDSEEEQIRGMGL